MNKADEVSVCDFCRAPKGVARNFSRGGLSGASGEGSPAVFQFPGGSSTPIFGRFNGQNERIFGPGGGHGPPCLCLPTPLFTDIFVIPKYYAESIKMKLLDNSFAVESVVLKPTACGSL